ncbi:helix-turn-helix domain-containing protein, partial [Mammaliicoccus vitulinus]|uniref:helix-turn-helix domain-containing protein n=1 Tax=Mammaliicoccus vitulinus TaxID=71237 RepID=UPI000D44BAB0
MDMQGTLGLRIKEYRKEHGMTLAELGEKVGVTHAYLSRVENNKVIPNDKLLEKIAEILIRNNTADTLNEFRVLAGYYNDVDEDSELYNDLKASGRLEIDYFDPDDMPDVIKEMKNFEKVYKKRNRKRIVER